MKLCSALFLALSMVIFMWTTTAHVEAEKEIFGEEKVVLASENTTVLKNYCECVMSLQTSRSTNHALATIASLNKMTQIDLSNRHSSIKCDDLCTDWFQLQIGKPEPFDTKLAWEVSFIVFFNAAWIMLVVYSTVYVGICKVDQ